MYLKKVILKNFQSHEYTEIELTKGINAIIGPSDSGKTSIIRGIRWALYNEPSGDAFRRHNTKETEVKLEFSDGFSLLRGRKTSTNYYKIWKTKDSEEVYYEAFGTKLPVEIEEHLGVRQVSLAKNLKDEINIARQLDPPFLLAESPRVKAEAIGRLSGAYVADLALEKLAKEIRDANSSIRVEEREIQEAEDALKDYEYLIEEEKFLNKIDYIFEQIENSQKLLKSLETFFQRFEKIKSQKTEEEKVLEQTKNIQKLEEIYNSLNSFLLKSSKLQSLYKRYSENQLGQKKSKEKLKKTKNVDILEEKRDLILEKLEKQNNLKGFYTNLIKIKKRQEENIMTIESFPVEESDLLIQHANESYQELQKLKELEKRLVQFYKKAQDSKKVVEKYRNLEKVEERLENIQLLKQKLEKLKQIEVKKEQVEKNTNALQNIYAQTKERIDKGAQSYQKILEHLKICPTCHGSLSQEQLERMLKDLKF